MPAHPRVHCNRGSTGVGFLCNADIVGTFSPLADRSTVASYCRRLLNAASIAGWNPARNSAAS
jgi:hypothetical protein